MNSMHDAGVLSDDSAAQNALRELKELVGSYDAAHGTTHYRLLAEALHNALFLTDKGLYWTKPQDQYWSKREMVMRIYLDCIEPRVRKLGEIRERQLVIAELLLWATERFTAPFRGA